MYYIWHNNAYPTYKDQVKAWKQYNYVNSLNNQSINADVDIATGTKSEATSFPPSKPSNIERGVNWRSYAPHDSADEWRWMPAEHKWVRFKTFAIRNAYVKWQKAINRYNAQMQAYKHGQSDREPDIYAMKRDKANYDNVQATVNRNNQEANAWFHQNYNGGSFYTLDTEHAPNMQQYLNSLSTDQLNDGIKYWNKQLITRHTGKQPLGSHKYKTIHYNTGDAVILHHEQNYNDPGNLVNQSINGFNATHSYNNKLGFITSDSMYGSGEYITHAVQDQLNNYGKQWNNALSNAANLHAKMQESTNRGNNYENTKNQYQNAKAQIKQIENNWKGYANQLHNHHVSKVLEQLLTSGKRQLMGIYYLNHTYYDRDMWRLNAFEKQLPIQEQKDRDASIREQIQNNNNNNLTSIYRADRKTDQVIGMVENTPNESIDMNLATEPVDNGMPQTNYAQTNQMQLTDTGDLYDRPLVFNPGSDDAEGQNHAITRWQAYNVLRTWEQQSVPLVIAGFNHWGNVLIQSLSKQPEQAGTQNALQITMTIQKVRIAQILWGKKPKVAPHKGRNNTNSKMYTVRSGDNIYDIAHGNVKEMHQIINANPSVKRHPNLIYPGQKVTIPQ